MHERSFKQQYKLQGIIASIVLMWLDYGLIYRGLVASDVAVVAAGLGVMVVAAAVAYYFG